MLANGDPAEFEAVRPPAGPGEDNTVSLGCWTASVSNVNDKKKRKTSGGKTLSAPLVLRWFKDTTPLSNSNSEQLQQSTSHR